MQISKNWDDLKFGPKKPARIHASDKKTYRTVCDATFTDFEKLELWGDPQMLDGGKHTAMEGTSLGVPAGVH